MKIHKVLILTVCAAFAFMATQQAAHASAWNKRTILHVHNPIQIPGVVLAPGSYTVHVVNPKAGENIVQFRNKSDHNAVATVIGIPDKATHITGQTRLTFYEPTPGNPPALREWFYPGMRYGIEFVYSQNQASGIAKSSNRYVPTMANADMQTFQQQAANSMNPPPASNARIYRTSPNGSQVSNQQGHQQNEKMDRNPSWKQQQNGYHGYADFQNSDSGSGQ